MTPKKYDGKRTWNRDHQNRNEQDTSINFVVANRPSVYLKSLKNKNKIKNLLMNT